MRSKLTLNKCSLAMMAAGAAIISSPALALNIFVCEPEWKALLESHAPDATIYSATDRKSVV